MNEWISMFLPGFLSGVFVAWGTMLRMDRLRREKDAKANEEKQYLMDTVNLAVQSAFIDERMRTLRERDEKLVKREKH